MSKINLNQVEASTTNGNLKLIPNGTGVLDVSGDTPGTLKLNDTSGNGVKIKAPIDSSAQAYTLTLPTTNFTQDQFIGVDSLTGSGSTAVGQLGYRAVTPPNANSINANNITSGIMPTARYSLAAIGGGLQLVQDVTLTADTSGGVSFTGLAANSMYKLHCIHSEIDTTGRLLIQWLDSNNVRQNNVRYDNWYGDGDNHFGEINYHQQLFVGTNPYRTVFEATFCTGDPDGTFTNEPKRSWCHLRGLAVEGSGSALDQWASFQWNQTNKRIHGLKVIEQSGNNLKAGSIFTLYKYNEG